MQKYMNEARQLLALAIPVIVAQVAQTAMGFVDTVMAGGYSATDMAAVAIGTSIWLPAILFGHGLLLALTPVIAQLNGSGRRERIAHQVRQGFWLAGFVSLLIMRSMLQPTGIVNTLLLKYGLIDTALPFFSSATWARVTVIVINLWVGIPYTLLQVTGILQNIPGELYEAAKIDGANAIQIFFKITLPYMLFVMTPYLITQFTGNINNFNVIYLLSGGNPTPVDATAGKTDLLVTWLYKLTVDKNYYNLGAVIGIMTFIVLAIVALVTYRNTASYKDEEGFM